MKWRTLSTQQVFRTPFFSIRREACRLPDGRQVDDYYIISAAHVVTIFALTPAQEVLFVEQYKHGIGQICWELPAGLCDADSPSPLHDAQRELLEETGYASAQWQAFPPLINNPTRYDNLNYCYLVREAVQVAEQALDANEDISVHRVPLADLPALLRSGRITVSPTLAVCWMMLDVLNAR